jgi:hypothetical protein
MVWAWDLGKQLKVCKVGAHALIKNKTKQNYSFRREDRRMMKGKNQL